MVFQQAQRPVARRLLNCPSFPRAVSSVLTRGGNPLQPLRKVRLRVLLVQVCQTLLPKLGAMRKAPVPLTPLLRRGNPLHRAVRPQRPCLRVLRVRRRG